MIPMHRPNLDIAFLYSENARAKIKDIAQALKLSSQRVKYNIDLLEKEAFIHHPHAILDHSYMGLLLFRVYFKGGYISEGDKLNIIRQLRDHPYITCIYEMSSGYDLVLELAAPNPSRFNKEIKRVAQIIPSLNNYEVTLNVVSHIYPRMYLSGLPHNVTKEIIVGGDRAVQAWTPSEMAVMHTLLSNPTQGISHIAKTTDLHQKTVKDTIKSLKQKKILKGFKYVLNSRKLGIRKFRLFLSLHNISSEREDRLLDFCLKTDEIVQMNKTIGDWDIEIDIASFREERIRQLTAQIRQDFKDLIESFSMAEIYQFYKKGYLPVFPWLPRPTDMKEPAGQPGDIQYGVPSKES
jgi:DNA-binding Lrp family transcriptional regulator